MAVSYKEQCAKLLAEAHKEQNINGEALLNNIASLWETLPNNLSTGQRAVLAKVIHKGLCKDLKIMTALKEYLPRQGKVISQSIEKADPGFQRFLAVILSDNVIAQRLLQDKGFVDAAGELNLALAVHQFSNDGIHPKIAAQADHYINDILQENLQQQLRTSSRKLLKILQMIDMGMSAADPVEPRELLALMVTENKKYQKCQDVAKNCTVLMNHLKRYVEGLGSASVEYMRPELMKIYNRRIEKIQLIDAKNLMDFNNKIDTPEKHLVSAIQSKLNIKSDKVKASLILGLGSVSVVDKETRAKVLNSSDVHRHDFEKAAHLEYLSLHKSLQKFDQIHEIDNSSEHTFDNYLSTLMLSEETKNTINNIRNPEHVDSNYNSTHYLLALKVPQIRYQLLNASKLSAVDQMEYANILLDKLSQETPGEIKEQAAGKIALALFDHPNEQKSQVFHDCFNEQLEKKIKNQETDQQFDKLLDHCLNDPSFARGFFAEPAFQKVVDPVQMIQGLQARCDQLVTQDANEVINLQSRFNFAAKQIVANDLLAVDNQLLVNENLPFIEQCLKDKVGFICNNDDLLYQVAANDHSDFDAARDIIFTQYNYQERLMEYMKHHGTADEHRQINSSMAKVAQAHAKDEASSVPENDHGENLSAQALSADSFVTKQPKNRLLPKEGDQYHRSSVQNSSAKLPKSKMRPHAFTKEAAELPAKAPVESSVSESKPFRIMSGIANLTRSVRRSLGVKLWRQAPKRSLHESQNSSRISMEMMGVASNGHGPTHTFDHGNSTDLYGVDKLPASTVNGDAGVSESRNKWGKVITELTERNNSSELTTVNSMLSIAKETDTNLAKTATLVDGKVVENKQAGSEADIPSAKDISPS